MLKQFATISLYPAIAGGSFTASRSTSSSSSCLQFRPSSHWGNATFSHCKSCGFRESNWPPKYQHFKNLFWSLCSSLQYAKTKSSCPAGGSGASLNLPTSFVSIVSVVSTVSVNCAFGWLCELCWTGSARHQSAKTLGSQVLARRQVKAAPRHSRIKSCVLPSSLDSSTPHNRMNDSNMKKGQLSCEVWRLEAANNAKM